MSAVAKREVLLYAPHTVVPEGQSSAAYRAKPPLSHLALAGPLRDAGYGVRIVDAKWDRDWRRTIRESVDRLACVGITSLTGEAVLDGLRVSAFVKSLRPDLPVVWGGWQATFAAAQAVEDPRVDVVVRGVGERAFVEVLQALETRESLRKIAGLNFREGAKPVATPDRPPEGIDQFPPPAYDLIEPGRYILSGPGGVRMAGTIFSRGCPFACDFCLDSKSRWFGLSIDRMLADIEFWIDHGANHIRFYDGNFFLGRQRIVDFCRAILARGLESKFRWQATAVGNRIVQMDDELLALLKLAGLEQVAIGAESGSDVLLSRITNKTTVENTLEAIRRLTRHGINQYLFFMVGYPDEPEDALELTLDMALQAKGLNPDVELFMNFTTPLPGSEVFRIAVERGCVEAPRVFEDWGRFDYTRPNLLPISRGYERRVKRFQRFLGLAFPPPAGEGLAAGLKRPVREVARWRLRRKHYGYPVELAAIDALHAVRRIGREW